MAFKHFFHLVPDSINVFVFGFIVGFLGSVSPAYAIQQSRSALVDPSEAIARIQGAINNGNAEEVARYVGTYVEVTQSGATTLHSGAQTAYILKAFFRDHPPERFTFRRRMKLGRDWFIYGDYWYRGDNRPYRIEFLLRWNGQRYEIKTIRFERVVG